MNVTNSRCSTELLASLTTSTAAHLIFEPLPGPPSPVPCRGGNVASERGAIAFDRFQLRELDPLIGVRSMR
jgi:hypothetical protein